MSNDSKIVRMFGATPGLSPERAAAHRIPTRVERAVRRFGLSYVTHRNGELVLRRGPDFDFNQSDQEIRHRIDGALESIEAPVAELLRTKYPKVRLK